MLIIVTVIFNIFPADYKCQQRYLYIMKQTRQHFLHSKNTHMAAHVYLHVRLHFSLVFTEN